jgi:MFS superfamily sulfate permease-like transporter
MLNYSVLKIYYIINHSFLGTFIADHLLPDSLISGLTTAAAFHIATSQIKGFFGISIPSYTGSWNLFETWYYFLSHVTETHWPTALVGFGTVFILLLTKHLNDRLTRVSTETRYNVQHDSAVGTEQLPAMSSQRPPTRCQLPFPIPDNLLAIAVAAIVVWLANQYFLSSHPIRIIGSIPSGLPTPILPWTKLCHSDIVSCSIRSVLVSCISPALQLSLISFVLSSAIAKLYARKYHYTREIQANRDLFALGMASLVGALLGQSFVVSGSLSRTAVAVKAGYVLL